MDDLKQYSKSTGNWRQAIRDNERRTKYVIVSFVIIYTMVGLLLDIFGQTFLHHEDFALAAHQVLTLQVFPYGTLLMMLGAIVGLFITFAMYDKLMLLGTEHRLITPDTAQDAEELQLYNIVEEMKIAAGMAYMPKIFVIDVPYMNAFASGYSQKSAMLAITRGLLDKLDREETQAVMAHELSHIRHDDIKLTLAASLLSNLLIIAIDILFRGMIYGGDGGKKNSGKFLALIMMLRVILPFVTVLLMLYMSRKREFMADAGAVELMRDNEPLARALLKISDDHVEHKEAYRHIYSKMEHEEARRASYIFDPTSLGLDSTCSVSSMFDTHPSLDARLKAIGYDRAE